jgi:hypothetical protein
MTDDSREFTEPTFTDAELERVHAELDKLFGARPAPLGGTGINPAFFSANTVVYVPTPEGIAALEAG